MSATLKTSDSAAADVRPIMPSLADDAVTGLGVLLALRRNALAAFPARCLVEPVVQLRLPGRALILVSDGAGMAELLQRRASDFVRMPAAARVLGPVAGRGLLTSSGEHWRRQRRAMAPAFTPRTLPMLSAHIVRAAEQACLRLEARESVKVDLFDEMQALSLEIAAISMFSIETSGFRAELRAMITEYMRDLGRPAPEDFLLPEWTPTPLVLKRRSFRRRWRRLIAGVVAERRGHGREGQVRDLFDLLADVHGDGSQDLLIDEVATMLVAGHETTGLTLFWALYLLAQAPDWADAVAREAAGVALTDESAAAALPLLATAHAVVQETLRLYSPAFMTARLAARSTELAGRPVPKGSMVLAPFFLLHRHPEHWRDPGRFDPSRFMGGVQRDRMQFMPFGAGPHVCIGAQLATAEAVLVIARFVRDFSLRLHPEARPVTPVATLSTRPDHAPVFLVSRRQP